MRHRVIISALEIIEAGLGIAVVSAISDLIGRFSFLYSYSIEVVPEGVAVVSFEMFLLQNQ